MVIQNYRAQVQALLEINEVAKSDSLFVLPPEVQSLLTAIDQKKGKDISLPFKIWA